MMTFTRKLKQMALMGRLTVSGILCMTFITSAQGNPWTFKTPIPTGRGFVSGAVVDGKIYVIGGFPSHYSVTAANEMYDPATDQWTVMTAMPEARCVPATCAYHGKIYVFGGVSPTPYGSANKNVYEYDPQTDTWTEKADMPYANAFCGIAVVNNTIYLIGGMLSYQTPPVSSMMAYNPLTETWSEKTPMPTARGWFSTCVLDEKIYTIGGTNENYHSVSYKVVEVYDPATNTWTTKADLPNGNVGSAACALDGKIYMVGGYRHPSTLTENLMYNPVTDTWSKKSSLQTRRHTCFSGTVEDKIYAVAGSYPSGSEPIILTSVEEYDAKFDTVNITSVGSTPVRNPESFCLFQNYPNPFNPVTTIDFVLPQKQHVVLNIYNLAGQKVEILMDEEMGIGKHQVNWNASNHVSGLYFLELTAGSKRFVKKMYLIK